MPVPTPKQLDGYELHLQQTEHVKLLFALNT
jgi:hypothetical protein